MLAAARPALAGLRIAEAVRLRADGRGGGGGGVVAAPGGTAGAEPGEQPGGRRGVRAVPGRRPPAAGCGGWCSRRSTCRRPTGGHSIRSTGRDRMRRGRVCPCRRHAPDSSSWPTSGCTRRRRVVAAGMWEGTYYLAGYAVECALKACIAKQIIAEDFPDKERNKAFHANRTTGEACPNRTDQGRSEGSALQRQLVASQRIGRRRAGTPLDRSRAAGDSGSDYRPVHGCCDGSNPGGERSTNLDGGEKGYPHSWHRFPLVAACWALPRSTGKATSTLSRPRSKADARPSYARVQAAFDEQMRWGHWQESSTPSMSRRLRWISILRKALES